LRILLDENLPWALETLLPGHEYNTVVRMGWGGVKNGKLLALAQKEFDIFLSVDRGLPF
jgi:predicted nuclease of predicted toxin-antitoxin system